MVLKHQFVVKKRLVPVSFVILALILDIDLCSECQNPCVTSTTLDVLFGKLLAVADPKQVGDLLFEDLFVS